MPCRGKGGGYPRSQEGGVGILGPMSGKRVSQVPYPSGGDGYPRSQVRGRGEGGYSRSQVQGGGVVYPNLTELPVTGLPNLHAH